MVNNQCLGPLQLAIHMVQSRHAGEQKKHWDKTNKENYYLKLVITKGYEVRATTIEGQNAFALSLC